LGPAGAAWGQAQSYGEVASAWDFATIGDPGNRGPIASEVPWWGLVNPGDPPPDIGRVDYEYRIATTEVTVA